MVDGLFEENWTETEEDVTMALGFSATVMTGGVLSTVKETCAAAPLALPLASATRAENLHLPPWVTLRSLL